MLSHLQALKTADVNLYSAFKVVAPVSDARLLILTLLGTMPASQSANMSNAHCLVGKASTGRYPLHAKNISTAILNVFERMPTLPSAALRRAKVAMQQQWY